MFKKHTPPAAPDLIARYEAALLAAWDERATFTSPEAIAVERPAAVQAIAAAVHGHVFTARELFQHARVDQALGAVLAGLRSPKQVGKRLRALAGRELGGLLLQRIGRDQSGMIWAEQVAPDLHRDPILSSRAGV